jgi:hypothetical protein
MRALIIKHGIQSWYICYKDYVFEIAIDSNNVPLVSRYSGGLGYVVTHHRYHGAGIILNDCILLDD